MDLYGLDEDLICIEQPQATHRLVLLHGWGADAEDLIPLGRDLIENNGINFELISNHVRSDNKVMVTHKV